MPHPSHTPAVILFTVRFWLEEIGAEQFEWRGEVKKLSNGQVYYFRNWQTLTKHMARMLGDESSM